MAYSEPPLRNMVRLIVTSAYSIGSAPSVLSMVSSTSARPSGGRPEVPAKMTSSILPPRSDLAPCSPITQASASTTLDLPEPLGPTMQVMPGSSCSVVDEAKDLNPFRVRLFRYNAGLLTRNEQALKRGEAQRLHPTWRVPRSRGGGWSQSLALAEASSSAASTSSASVRVALWPISPIRQTVDGELAHAGADLDVVPLQQVPAYGGGVDAVGHPDRGQLGEPVALRRRTARGPSSAGPSWSVAPASSCRAQTASSPSSRIRVSPPCRLATIATGAVWW